jgi:hypothetical protein
VVTHYDVSRDDVEHALRALRRVVEAYRQNIEA